MPFNTKVTTPEQGRVIQRADNGNDTFNGENDSTAVLTRTRQHTLAVALSPSVDFPVTMASLSSDVITETLSLGESIQLAEPNSRTIVNSPSVPAITINSDSFVTLRAIDCQFSSDTNSTIKFDSAAFSLVNTANIQNVNGVCIEHSGGSGFNSITVLALVHGTKGIHNTSFLPDNLNLQFSRSIASKNNGITLHQDSVCTMIVDAGLLDEQNSTGVIGLKSDLGIIDIRINRILCPNGTAIETTLTGLVSCRANTISGPIILDGSGMSDIRSGTILGDVTTSGTVVLNMNAGEVDGDITIGAGTSAFIFVTEYDHNVNTVTDNGALNGIIGEIAFGTFQKGYRGVFATLAALQAAFPVGATGDTATVTDPDGNLFYWDGAAWTDTGTGFLGDMLKAVYDPTAVNGDTFSMGNMFETSTKKVFTDTERDRVATAIHTDIAGEIAGITTKSSIVSDDLLVIEDSEDSNNKKKVTVGDLAQSLPVQEADTLTGTVNNYALSDIDAVNIVRFMLTGDVIFTGVVAPSPARSKLLLIENADDSDVLKIQHDDGGSLAANRILCPDNTEYVIKKNGAVTISYDPVSSRWRTVSSPQ